MNGAASLNCSGALLDVVVCRKLLVAHEIIEIELADPHGAALPAFTAGSHVDVHLKDGMVRQYSLCNDPAERHRYLLGVQRAPVSRGGSCAMHDSIQPGDRLRISTPRNLFPLAEAPHSLLLAGGIGITPLLSMAETLHRVGSSFSLHYCARSSDRLAFLERMGAAPWSSQLHCHVDAPAGKEAFDIASALARAPAGSHVYTCGPSGFMQAVVQAAHAQGWDDERVHLEHFGAAPVDVNGNKTFVIRIASTGRTVTVPPDLSALQALEQNGIELPVSCEQGVCGTCLTTVLAGEPDHRDSFLNEKERARNDCFTPCCSRALSAELVLDL